MASSETSDLLRPGLLAGVSVLLARCAGAPEAPAQAIATAVAQLGAAVGECELAGTGPQGAAGEEEIDGEVERALAELGDADVGVVDAWGLHRVVTCAAAERGDGRRALGACMEASWSFTRSLATRAFIGGDRRGRIVLVAPAAGAGAHAGAALAGLENLGRTLSIEWARYGITVVTIAPGAHTGPQEVAALAAFLASPAGAYFSGCLLDLRGPGKPSVD